MEILNRHHLRGAWPDGAVYVGRGHPLGNPFVIGHDGNREEVIRLYRDHLERAIARRDPEIVCALRALDPQSVLVCSCAPAPCHAEVIAELWQQHCAALPPAVFVFGSNLAGRHGKGAALAAKDFYGARLGVGAGPTGRAYAIPTKDGQLRVLSVPQILPYVRAFIRHAGGRPDLEFLVSAVGCGLAGYDPVWIAPLFAGAPPNCRFLSPEFDCAVPRPERRLRIIVAGSRSIVDPDQVWPALDRLADERFPGEAFEVVCGEAPGPDTLGRQWAERRGYPVHSLPAPWEMTDVPGAAVRTRRDGARYNAAAGQARNVWMAAYGTHLVAFWDGKSLGTRGMIALATAECLPVWRPGGRTVAILRRGAKLCPRY